MIRILFVFTITLASFVDANEKAVICASIEDDKNRLACYDQFFQVKPKEPIIVQAPRRQDENKLKYQQQSKKNEALKEKEKEKENKFFGLSERQIQKAKNIAFSIANSPLVKTAVAGEDPNWGRILMGIGKTGEKKKKKKIIIKLGESVVAVNGKISDDYDEEKLKEYMKWDSILIEVDLKQGREQYECYTCDFTHDYIDINAHYRRS